MKVRLAAGFACLLACSSLYLSAQNPTSTLPKLKAGDPLPVNLFVDLAKAVNPAIVNIFTTYLPKRQRMQAPYRGRDPLFDLFEQFMIPPQGMQAMPQQSLGTGFIIREDGLIVTNNHVIDKADVIKVQLDEVKKEEYTAKVIGKDPRTDIALIKIEAKKKLPFLKMGNSSDVQVGEWVAAFGNPYGYGHTVTKGIISAIGRELDELNLLPFMQTDASIHPGNSGGPLVNTQGLVIGVNTAVDARASGSIGFVIPIDNVKNNLPQLEKTGNVEYGFLGINLQDIDEENARSLNIKQTEGALVVQIVQGTPAEKAGLEPYDLIVEYNGKKVSTSGDLMKMVATTPAGTKVNIKVLRNSKPRNLTATVGSTGDMSKVAKTATKGKGGLTAPFNLGFQIADYTAAIADEFNLPQLRQPHPVITAVDPTGEAANSGLAPGDIILDVNRKEVARAADVGRHLKKGTINILRVLKRNRVVLVSLKAS